MIEVTSPDRVVYPSAGFTKAQVVGHYARVAERMLPHLLGRPLTLFRHPRGLAGRGFFQKQAKPHYPAFLERISIPKRGGTTDHVSVRDADGLCYLANQGVLELHAPLRRLPDLARPDRLVLDLDPPEGSDPAQVQGVALLVRALLDELGAASVPVASGGKGYHLTVALEGEARGLGRAVHALAAILAHRHPDLCTVEVLKADRGGRVLVDWMRSGLQSTVIVPWSLRARPGASVAVPLTWDELPDTAPDQVRLDTVGAWLERPDPLLALAPTPAGELIEAVEGLRARLGVELVSVDRFGRRSGA